MRTLTGLQASVGNRAVCQLLGASAFTASPSGSRHISRCETEVKNKAAVQRFGSAEHVRIGEEAVPGETVLITGYGHISYGEMIALGVCFGSVNDIGVIATSLGPWRREQIDYARWKVNPRGRPRPNVSPSAVEAVEERYYRLAARNETHFSTGSAPGSPTGSSTLLGTEKPSRRRTSRASLL